MEIRQADGIGIPGGIELQLVGGVKCERRRQEQRGARTRSSAPAEWPSQRSVERRLLSWLFSVPLITSSVLTSLGRLKWRAAGEVVEATRTSEARPPAARSGTEVVERRGVVLRGIVVCVTQRQVVDAGACRRRARSTVTAPLHSSGHRVRFCLPLYAGRAEGSTATAAWQSVALLAHPHPT
jgi:hypothetical protein